MTHDAEKRSSNGKRGGEGSQFCNHNSSFRLTFLLTYFHVPSISVCLGGGRGRGLGRSYPGDERLWCLQDWHVALGQVTAKRPKPASPGFFVAEIDLRFSEKWLAPRFLQHGCGTSRDTRKRWKNITAQEEHDTHDCFSAFGVQTSMGSDATNGAKGIATRSKEAIRLKAIASN